MLCMCWLCSRHRKQDCAISTPACLSLFLCYNKLFMWMWNMAVTVDIWFWLLFLIFHSEMFSSICILTDFFHVWCESVSAFIQLSHYIFQRSIIWSNQRSCEVDVNFLSILKTSFDQYSLCVHLHWSSWRNFFLHHW